MRNWFSSLQFRLIAGFALVLVLTLGSVSFYVGLAAEREVESFENRRDEVNEAILRLTESPEWRLIQRAYLGEAP